MKKVLNINLIIMVLFILILNTNIFAQESIEKYGNVNFDFHYAKWEFKEIEYEQENIIYYNVYFNAGSVVGYEMYEENEKKSICKVYYNKFDKIEKWEIFNRKKVTQTAKFIYNNDNNLEIIEIYEHKGMITHLSKKHYYNRVRYKLEEYDSEGLRKLTIYYDTGQIKQIGNFDNGEKDGKWIFKDRYGRILKVEEYYGRKLVAVTTYSYNDDGQKIKEVLTDGDGNIYKLEETSYNDNNQIKKEIISDGNGIIKTVEYFYNIDEQKIKEVVTHSDGDVYTTIYRYDNSISITDAIERRKYLGDEKTGEIITIIIAEFDIETKEFIAYIKYNKECKIISLTYYDKYMDGGSGGWVTIKKPKEIAYFLNFYNYSSSCSI